MRIGRSFTISGRVQGVGFRFFARDAALREGLVGAVRNLDDGRVEIQAAGEAEAMDRFERAIRRGPPAARVEHVDVEPAAPSSSTAGFFIDG
jgi:acylphosphatase